MQEDVSVADSCRQQRSITPGETVQRLNGHMRKALATPDVVDSLATFGLDAQSSTPAELAALLQSELAKWGPIVKRVGFTAEG